MNLEFNFTNTVHRNPSWLNDDFKVSASNIADYMKEKIVRQYTCEFCGKKRYRRHIMAMHELHCTANPDRECRMCKVKRNIPEIIFIVKTTARLQGHELAAGPIVFTDEKPETSKVLQHIEELTDGCPACILAVHRVGKFFTEFDFKKASELWFARKMEEESDQQRREEERLYCQPVSD